MSGERKFINENTRRVLLKEYMMKEVDRAGFGGIDIQRTPLGTRVTLITERPGLVIGRKGGVIKSLTRQMEELFDFDNPQIEVQEDQNPNLNAQIMAKKLAFALERGWHFRRAGHSTVRRIMDSGARGCQVIISGKLTGQRHRTEKFKEGHIKYCGEPKRLFMREGFAAAKLKLGVIGVKVQIMVPDARLPDEIIIKDPLKEGIEIPPEPAPLESEHPEEPQAVEAVDGGEGGEDQQ
ncbi:MAG: 30S ribosomal protein S3 [Thermoplasmata archaeon YP2-bin.285]|uniref:Small ribosomal subunit protein uS3 n=3 Tax=Candidatus Sysuiplasma superficiale TaxID=2823368 RepID=A0A8J7YQE2_9ARCH|nr:30S ribosomal protein S3 [Candidatus Sysuiplasma superficiale]